MQTKRTEEKRSILKSILGKYLNVRREKRMAVISSLRCQVSNQKQMEAMNVQVLNISRGGIAFCCKSEQFQIGDKVQLSLASNTGKSFSVEGEIISQHIFYPANTNELKHAILRFSVRFEKEIGSLDQLSSNL